MWAWTRINTLFNWLPLAALVEDRIICMHGGACSRPLMHAGHLGLSLLCSMPGAIVHSAQYSASTLPLSTPRSWKGLIDFGMAVGQRATCNCIE